MAPPRKILRFAVGSPEEYRSAIWRLWVQGNDVYLADRAMGAQIKFSLHRSGIWRLAWTKESGILAQDSTDRLEEKWQRPPEFLPGWTRGPAVIVPNVGIEKPFRRRPDTEGKPIVWAPTPALGNRCHFVLLFLDPGVSEDTWGSVADSPGTLVGTLDLPNGERVLVSRHEAPLVEKERLFIEKHKGGTWFDYPGPLPELAEASFFTYGIDDAGFPYALDIPFGWENLRIVKASAPDRP